MEAENEREDMWRDHMGYSAHYPAHLKLLIRRFCEQYTFTHLWFLHFYYLTIFQYAPSFYFLDFYSRLAIKN